MFGSGGVKVNTKTRKQADVRRRKRKPKRAVGETCGSVKCDTSTKTKTSALKLIKRGGSWRKTPKAKTKKTMRQKQQYSFESKNPIFEPRSLDEPEEQKKEDIKNNYIYANFIAGSPKKTDDCRSKRSSRSLKPMSTSRSEQKKQELCKQDGPSSMSLKRLSHSSDISFELGKKNSYSRNSTLSRRRSTISRRNSTLGKKRSSTLHALQFHLSDMSVEQDLGAEKGPSEVTASTASDLSNLVMNLSIEEVPEENEFNSISAFHTLMNTKQTPQVTFESVALPLRTLLEPQYVAEPLKVDEEQLEEPDCYLAAYQTLLEKKEETEAQAKKRPPKETKPPSKVSKCSGCDQLHLQAKLVQPEDMSDSDELSDMFYCKDCFQEIFGNASYRRALVFKKLRVEKGTQKKDAKPVKFVQTHKNDSSYGGSYVYRKESESTEYSI